MDATSFRHSCFSPVAILAKGTALLNRSFLEDLSAHHPPAVVKVLRALFAIGFLIVLLVFGCYLIILEPFRDTGLVPSKFYQTLASTHSCDIRITEPVLTIIATAYVPFNTVLINPLQAAVDVIAVGDPVTQSQLRCELLPDNPKLEDRKMISRIGMSSGNMQAIAISCTPSAGPEKAQQVFMGVDLSYNVCGTHFIFPDLLITALDMTSDSLIGMRGRAVSILVGLTNDTADVISDTHPTPLSPGSHLLGSISPRLRRRLNKNSHAALGALSSSRTFLVSDIVTLTPDPSPLVPRLENTSTLRLFYQGDFSKWSFSEEYQEKSVLSGFSALGGFWTFLNGTFALVFGSSLMLNLFGIKPLSDFGLVHCFQQRRLHDAFQAAFPRIRTEGGVPGSEQAGLVAFLRERLVDLDALGDDIDDIESQHQSLVATNEPPVHMRAHESADHIRKTLERC